MAMAPGQGAVGEPHGGWFLEALESVYFAFPSARLAPSCSLSHMAVSWEEMDSLPA